MTGPSPPDPVYLVRLVPTPGTDVDKALRWVLKTLYRRFGMRCISIEREDEYNARKDLAGSIAEGFRAMRERQASGGPGWTRK